MGSPSVVVASVAAVSLTSLPTHVHLLPRVQDGRPWRKAQATNVRRASSAGTSTRQNSAGPQVVPRWRRRRLSRAADPRVRSSGDLRFSSHEGHGGGDVAVLVGWEECAHQIDQLSGEERVPRRIVDGEGTPPDDVELREPDLGDLVCEDTLREGPGYSTGPGGRVGEDLRGQLLLTDGQVRGDQPPPWTQYPESLREHTALACAEVDGSVGDDDVHRSIGHG